MMNKLINQALDAACRKTKANIEKIGGDLREFRPREDGRYFDGPRDRFIPLAHIYNWMQSSFTGMAGLAFHHTKDTAFPIWINQFYTEYYRKVFEGGRDTMHDLGFLFVPYSTLMYKLLCDNKMKELSIQAANVLCRRFIPKTGCLQAWGVMDGSIPDYIEAALRGSNFFTKSAGLMIIDSMMNLPLLFWAGEATGEPFYTRVARMHADATLKNIIRSDGSVCHAYRFDIQTGLALEEFCDCGYGIGSFWARGCAWAIYGFAAAYRYTKNAAYLKTAMDLSREFIDQCGNSLIPVWDFRLPADTPALYSGAASPLQSWDIHDPACTIHNIDTSASTIACCGMLELAGYDDSGLLDNYVNKATEKLICNYMNTDPDVPGLLSHQNGNMSYAPFGDYFMVELLTKIAYPQLGPLW